MRTPQNGRKSCGGITLADYQRRGIAVFGDQNEMSVENSTVSGNDNNGLMSNNRIPLTARKSTGGKIPSNHQTIADLQRRQSLTENGVQKQAIVPAMENEKNSTELANNLVSTSGEHQCNQDSESDNFTLQLSTEKTSDAFSTLDEIMSNGITENQASSKKDIRKRPTSSSQSGTAKKSKINEKNLCKKFMDELNDKNVLLNELSQQIDLEDILKAYKEKKTAEDIEKEAVKVLGLESKKESTNPDISNNMSAANMSCLQNILSELYKLYGNENFTKISLKTIRDRLNPSDILEYFSVNEVKEALFQKYPPVELVNQLTNRDPSVVSEILKSASVDEIVGQVRKRNELSTSESLLQAMLESFSQVISEETSPDCNNTANNAPISQVALCSAFTNAVKSKKYLNSCEDLLNVLLRNGPMILSEESKMNLKNILEKKFSGPEFNDISHEVTRYHLSKESLQ